MVPLKSWVDFCRAEDTAHGLQRPRTACRGRGQLAEAAVTCGGAWKLLADLDFIKKKLAHWVGHFLALFITFLLSQLAT